MTNKQRAILFALFAATFYVGAYILLDWKIFLGVLIIMMAARCECSSLMLFGAAKREKLMDELIGKIAKQAREDAKKRSEENK